MASGKRVVRYTGMADVRTISKAQFGTVDLDHEAVRFERSNGFQQEVSQEVGQWLIDNDNFEAVEPEKA